METKKYTFRSSFWWFTVIFFLWAIVLSIDIIRRRPSDILQIVLLSPLIIYYLVVLIKVRSAWHSYMEISSEGVKMKGCAKRISNNKKENVDDLFIPWDDIEEVKGWFGYPELVLKTGEKITLTHLIIGLEVDGQTVEKAFEQYKSKQRQKELEPKTEPEQLKDDIISVISEVDDKDKI